MNTSKVSIEMNEKVKTAPKYDEVNQKKKEISDNVKTENKMLDHKEML